MTSHNNSAYTFHTCVIIMASRVLHDRMLCVFLFQLANIAVTTYTHVLHYNYGVTVKISLKILCQATMHAEVQIEVHRYMYHHVPV